MEKDCELHPIFVHDPEIWMQYVYKKVSVLAENGKEHEGWVYTIDPVSQNFVLVRFTEENVQLSIVMSDTISQVTVLGEPTANIKDKLDTLFRPKSDINFSKAELKAREQKLKLWLEKNRLPVEMRGSHNEILSVSDALMIYPPYRVDDCHSTNEIILGRIQGLILNMPADQDD